MASVNQSPVLVATLTDVRHFATILRSVAFQQRVKVIISEPGLCIVAEEAHTLQAQAFVPFNVFTSYKFNLPEDEAHEPSGIDDNDDEEDPTPQVTLEINLHHLLECLNIFGNAGSVPIGSGGDPFAKKQVDDFDDDSGGSDGEGGKRRGGGGKWKERDPGGSDKATGRVTAGRISWVGRGHNLDVHLQDEASGPTTVCSLGTAEADPTSSLDFDRDHSPELRIILSSSWLRDVLQSIDPSSDRVTLSTIAPEADPTGRGVDFRVESDGTFGSVQMDFKNERPVVLIFERLASVRHTFRKSLLLRVLRALASSAQTSIQLFGGGLIVIQCNMVDGKLAELPPARDPVERERRKRDLMLRKRGEIHDGIVEFAMMSLENE